MKNSSKLIIIYGTDFPLWLLIGITQKDFLTILCTGSITTTVSKPMTSPQVILRISDQQGIILNLWGCGTRPFLSSINSFWALSLISPTSRYAWSKHTICHHALLPPLPSHASWLTRHCTYAWLPVWKEHCIFLFSLGTSSLIILCILYFSSITGVDHSMDMEIFVENDW